MTNLEKLREMYNDKDYRPEVLRVCAHTRNSCSMTVVFGDNLITISNTVGHPTSLDKSVKECMKRCIIEAMQLGHSEKDLEKRKIIWLSINGSIIVDKQ